MPTTYSGDKTQTQAPSDPPEPQGTIQASLPADGDPPNASTFAQAYKVCADFIDWLMKPQAVAGPTLWEIAIQAWRAANGHKRFAIDHLGFPTGQVMVKDVNWVPSSAGGLDQTGTAASFTAYRAMPDWSYKALQTAGLSYAAMGAGDYGPALGVRAGEGLNDYTTVYHDPMGRLRADNHVSLETSVVGHESTITTHVGLCEEPSTHIGANAAFIGFRITGAVFWDVVTRAAGVETVTTTAVGASISGSRPDRLRVEWSGETVADDSVRAVRFYINGALVATHTTNLPLNMLVGIGISGKRVSAHAASEYVLVGPMRLRMSLSELDTVL